MARLFGYIKPEDLLSQITAQQAREWEMFTALEPFPEDLITDTLCNLANVIAVGLRVKKGGGRFKPQDFRPKYKLKFKQDYQSNMDNIKSIFMGLVKRTKPKKKDPRIEEMKDLGEKLDREIEKMKSK